MGRSSTSGCNALARSRCHFQPVSYFGRIPAVPNDGMRITIPEILREIEAQTQGRIRVQNFKPPGCENAPCSFHGNFVLLEEGGLLPWTRHSPCCTQESAAEGAVKTRRFVNRSWAPSQIDEIGARAAGDRTLSGGLGYYSGAGPDPYFLHFRDGLSRRLEPGPGAPERLLYPRGAPGWPAHPLLRLQSDG